MKKLTGYFLQGLLYLAPTGITIYIVYLVFTFIDGPIQNFLHKYISLRIPGLGLLIVVILITLLGLIGKTIFFKPVRNFIDNVMNRAPLIKVIYSAIHDLLSAFVGKEKRFNQPVLVVVNTISNLEKMGFITQEDLSDLEIKDKVAVYFPHSYNFSGEMFIVPKELIRQINIPPTDAMKFIVSGGITKV